VKSDIISLQDTLRASFPLLPMDFRAAHAWLFEEEHVARLADRLLRFAREGVPAAFPLPHFAAECTPPLSDAWAFFREPVAQWQAADDKLSPPLLQRFADALPAAGCKNLLILLGQRLTPASLTDARAIPPARARLLASANREHNPADHLTVAARALSKHAHRSLEAFWGGEVRGSVAEKNARAVEVLNRILDHATWWNVFGHFAHDLVYEARVPSGHGARWGFGGDEFIGFLEPFDEERCPSLEQEADEDAAGPP
jgi:hypothetical protein